MTNLVRSSSTRLGDNEPLDVFILTSWSMEGVTQDGIAGTLLRAAVMFVSEIFLPDENEEPIDEASAQLAVRDVALALMSNVQEIATNDALRESVLEAVVSGTSSGGPRMNRPMESFRMEGGLGATPAGQQARREVMQRHAQEGRGEMREPIPPVIPATELRCAPLPEEPRSPQSLNCHQCQRIVGAGAPGTDKSDNRYSPLLISAAGRCAVCDIVVCGYCYCDRGLEIHEDGWPDNATPFSVARESKLA